MTPRYLLPSFLILFFSCNSRSNRDENNSKYVATYEKDGKKVTKEINDSTAIRMIKQLASGQVPTAPKPDTVFNEFGNPKLVRLNDDFFGATEKQFVYDKAHHLVKVIGYDDQKNIKPFFEDIAIETYKYDARGNEIEIRYFGADGKPVRMELIGPAIIRSIYNSKNKLVQVQYLDENEQPLPDSINRN